MEEISLSKKQLSFNKRRALISFVCIFAVVLVFVVGGVFIGRWWVKNDPMNPWKVESYQSDMEEGDLEHLLLPMNETMTIDVENYAKKWGVENKAWKLSVADDCVRIDEDTLTPVERGWTVLTLQITDGSTVYSSDIARIVVISSDPFKSVSTADELSAIRDNLDGNYILTADIDLSGMEWTPIGNALNEFTGAMLNLDGHKIKNLTMTYDAESGGHANYYRTAGLFGFTVNAYIDGLILQGVNISLSEGDRPLSEGTSGSLVGDAAGTLFVRCVVQGTIEGQGSVGGLVGYASLCIFEECIFNGDVSSAQKSNPNVSCFAGGIVGNGLFYGVYFEAVIADCLINANISSDGCAGGIVGHEFESYEFIQRSYFYGTLQGTTVVAT